MPSRLHGLPVELPLVPQSCGHVSSSLTAHTPSPHTGGPAASACDPPFVLFDEQATASITASATTCIRIMRGILLIATRRSTTKYEIG